MSNTTQKIKQETVESFGHAYREFGYKQLMGRIVGLLLWAEKPLSLDDMARELNMSKGPISQMTQRLKDHLLIRQVWVPGDRKDYYELVPDVFGQAFRNQLQLVQKNLALARRLRTLASENAKDATLKAFGARTATMEKFYTKMVATFKSFLQEWEEESSG